MKNLLISLCILIGYIYSRITEPKDKGYPGTRYREPKD